jgi:dynein heavy chain, axonemal
MLSSEGFKHGKPISNKIVVLYQLMSQQLSKQDHYDFGLRAIKSVLTCAGAIRRDSSTESPLDKVDKKDKELIKELEEQELNQEILILMKAIMDMNIPKFVGEDIPLFNSLFNDLFPNIEMQEMNNEQFLVAVEAEIRKAGLQPKAEQIKKVVQLYDSKNTRHGNMLVGTSMSGKSTTWKILKNTLNTLNKENSKKYPQVKH